MSAPEPVAVLGAGMHAWGKWGRPFHEYGIDANRPVSRRRINWCCPTMTLPISPSKAVMRSKALVTS